MAAWRLYSMIRVIVLVLVLAYCACFAGETRTEKAEETQDMQRHVWYLVETLVAVRGEADALRGRLAELEFGKSSAVTLKPERLGARDAEQPRLLDVNRALRVAVLDRGARHGVRAGMWYAVMRNGVSVGVVQVIDVREKVAGAVVLSQEKGVFPEADDKLMRIAGLQK